MPKFLFVPFSYTDSESSSSSSSEDNEKEEEKKEKEKNEKEEEEVPTLAAVATKMNFALQREMEKLLKDFLLTFNTTETKKQLMWMEVTNSVPEFTNKKVAQKLYDEISTKKWVTKKKSRAPQVTITDRDTYDAVRTKVIRERDAHRKNIFIYEQLLLICVAYGVYDIPIGLVVDLWFPSLRSSFLLLDHEKEKEKEKEKK
jgi:hypothetical protein